MCIRDRVKGDSMEPRISDGDLALVHRQPTLENGDLGVVIFGEGEGTLKKFIRRGNTIILQPFNNVYAPQIIICLLYTSPDSLRGIIGNKLLALPDEDLEKVSLFIEWIKK